MHLNLEMPDLNTAQGGLGLSKEAEFKHADAVEKLLRRLPWEVEPEGPEVYALAREWCALWRTNQRRAWQAERSATFEARVAGEHERLVKVFAGPVGLDPQEWPRVPRKLELVAQRNVQRADNAEKERREVEAWDTRPMLQALVHGLNTALRARLQANRAGPPPGFTVEPQPLKSTQSQHPRFAAGEGRVGGESGREGDARLSVAAIALLKRATVRQKAAHMDSMQRELAASVVQRMRTMGRSMRHRSFETVREEHHVGGSEGDDESRAAEEELAMMRRLAQGMRANMTTHAQRHLPRSARSMRHGPAAGSLHASADGSTGAGGGEMVVPGGSNQGSTTGVQMKAAAVPGGIPARMDSSTGACAAPMRVNSGSAGTATLSARGPSAAAHHVSSSSVLPPDRPNLPPPSGSFAHQAEPPAQEGATSGGEGEGVARTAARMGRSLAVTRRGSNGSAIAGSIGSVAGTHNVQVGRTSGGSRASLRSFGAITSMLGALGGSGTGGSNRRSTAAARAARKVVVSPLVQSYLDVCKASGYAHSQQVADQLGISEATGSLSLEGAALPDGAATSLAAVLPGCKHLKGVSFTRTVLNASAVAALLPALRVLRLDRVELSAADMPPDAWPHLVEALSRPTVSLAQPPSEWWMCVKTLSLEGNPLGDRGLAVLLDSLSGMRTLTNLSLSQTSLTEWSAPMLSSLLRSEGAAKVRSLDLSGNQLGPQAGAALAAALPAATALTELQLSWNPMGGGVQHVLWALQGPRTGASCHLTSLSLAGCDLEADDHMALAALLKFGAQGGGGLKKLDLSHNALVGVSAQCLMRQLDALLPPLPPLQQDVVQSAASTLASLVGTKLGFGAPSAAPSKHPMSAMTSLATSSKTATGVPRLHLAQVIQAAQQTQHAGQGCSAVGADSSTGGPNTTAAGTCGAGGVSGRSQAAANSSRAVARPGTAGLLRAAGGLSHGSQAAPHGAPRPQSGLRASFTSTCGRTSNAGSVGSVVASVAPTAIRPDAAAAAATAASMDAGGSPAGTAAAFAAARREALENSMQVLTLGCRVELDGGEPPTPRARAATGGAPMAPVPARTVSAYTPPRPETRVTAALAVAWPTGTPRDRATLRRVPVLMPGAQASPDSSTHATPCKPDSNVQLPSEAGHVAPGPGSTHAQSDLQPVGSQGPSAQPGLPHNTAAQPASGAVTTPASTACSGLSALQQFVLDLSRARPDRFVAQLLVEHEVAGRAAHVRPPVWRTVILDGKLLRLDGADVVPFDVLYKGWGNPGALPKSGRLELHVACVPQTAAPWLQNPRLQFNAARLLQQGTAGSGGH